MIMHPEGVPARVFCDPSRGRIPAYTLFRGYRPYGLTPRLIAVSPPGSGGPKTGQQSRANLDALAQVSLLMVYFKIPMTHTPMPHMSLIVFANWHEFSPHQAERRQAPGTDGAV
jgi:hypothetical protein